MRIQNIVVKKTYQKNGEEKATWLQVGRLIEFDATEDRPAQLSIELNMFPSTKFYVFEQKKKDEARPAQTEETIDGDGIPF